MAASPDHTKSVHALTSPLELVRKVLHSTEAGFVREHAQCLFLAIRLESRDLSLLAGLAAALSDAPQSVAKPARAIGWNRDLPKAVPRNGWSERPSNNVLALRGSLLRYPHYVVYLQRRAQADLVFIDRISVGRARNQDIVLRDMSVSRSHAWFGTDGNGAFWIADSGSRNGTFINRNRLPAQTVQQVEPGDAIEFGYVHAVVCDARSLWCALSRR